MVNKASLMRSAAKSTGLSLRDASACIDSVIDSISEAISHGERIELRGLGSFEVKRTASKKYPSAFAAEKVVPAHGKVFFRPCQKLRESVWNKAGGI